MEFCSWIPCLETDALPSNDCLVGLVVMASASRAEDLELDFCLRCGDYSGMSHTSALNIGSPVVTLSDAWCFRVNAGTGWPGISIL